MQYLVSVIEEKTGSEIDEKTGSGTPTEMAAIDAFNDRLQAENHWVFAGGLASPSTATVIDNRDGRRISPMGPFWNRRSTSAASGSSMRPTSTWP